MSSEPITFVYDEATRDFNLRDCSISVREILEELRAQQSFAGVLARHPELKGEQIDAALRFCLYALSTARFGQ